MAVERISFLVPHPPKALRPNRRAAHWATRAKAADEYSEVVVDQAYFVSIWPKPELDTAIVTHRKTLPWERARVTYTWRYAGVAPDIDNIAGALKCLQDTLCVAPPPNKRSKDKRNRWYLGLIENDSGIEATFKREKVKHKADEGVLVEVARL